MKLAVIDDILVSIRLRTIYRSLEVQDYDKTRVHIINLIDVMRKTQLIDMSRDMYNRVLDSMMHMRIDLAMKRYSKVHNDLRDLQIAYLTRFSNSDEEYKLYW